MTRPIIGTVLLALVLVAPGAFAMGGSSSSSGSSKASSSASAAKRPSDYDAAVKAVDAGDYRRALGLLERVVASDAGDADAWNYIGFSNRKLARYDAALAAYRKALAIEPRHRGALEYLGELYLDMGDVAKAEEQLEKLDSMCYSRCEEVDELKAAIAKRKRG